MEKKSPSKKSIRQRRQARREAQRKQNIRSILIVAAFIISGAIYLGWQQWSIPQVPQERLVDQPYYGPADAPVVITEFSDFTCVSCKSWHMSGVLHDIVEMYDGLVKVEWRDFPVITADSENAAEAGQCAHDQGRFWDYLDRVYNEPGSAFVNGGEEDLYRYAEEIGLDMTAFESCLDSNQHRATVEYDLEAARGQGFTGAPTFVVNGTRIVGGTPELVLQAVEKEIAELEQ